MPGLRIYHPDLRSAVIEVPVPANGPRGTDKIVRIVIDADGYALVSDGVWGELGRSSSIGHVHQFIIMNEVPDPPALLVGGGVDNGRRTYRVEQEALQEIAPAGLTAKVVEHGLPPSIRSN